MSWRNVMSTIGFWRELRQDNRNVLLTGFGQLQKAWYLFPQGNGPRGSFQTFSELAPNLRNRDVVILGGVLREQAVAPEVYDVTIIGAANTPRQATSSGTPTGGGATWMAPTSPVAATPLLEVVRQGWSFQNITFNPPTNSAAIRLTTSGGLNEAGQCRVTGCTFLGGGSGQIGIEDNGGSGFVVIDNNIFQLLTGTAILSLSTANAVPLSWHIHHNVFRQNTNDVKMSLSRALIQWNSFMTAGSGATNKVVSTTFISTQGGNNFIIDNQFNNTEAQIAPGSGYTGAATDVWRNFVTDGTWYAIGQPA